MDRRDFIKSTAAGAAGLWLGGSAFPGQAGRKTRYAIIGTGGRHSMYRDAILKTYASTSELVALCDVNQGRLRLSQAKGKAMAGVDVPLYLASDFDRMIAERKPDVVIVTTVDVFHHQYIVRAMELGCDVDHRKADDHGDEKCRAILDAHQADRPQVPGHLQLPLLPAPHPGQGPADERRHRRHPVGGLPLAAQHLATGPTTSAAGTARRSSARPDGATRPRTTSTWSTGGSRPSRSRSWPRASASSTRPTMARRIGLQRPARALPHLPGEGPAAAST